MLLHKCSADGTFALLESTCSHSKNSPLVLDLSGCSFGFFFFLLIREVALLCNTAVAKINVSLK